MSRFITVKFYTLCSHLLLSVLTQFLKPSISHVVVGVGLFHRKLVGEHRRIDLHVCLNTVKNHFCPFLNEFVIIHQVKEN